MFIVSGGVLPGQGRGNESVAQGMQQHPQVMRMARKQAMDVKMAIAFHLPNMPRIQASTGLSIPEASFSSVDRARRPLRGLGDRPVWGRVVGDERVVQHCSPNMAQTPPFSARSMSRATRFWKAIREVAASWVEMPSTASRVRLARALHIVVDVVNTIDVFVWRDREES